MIIKDKKMQDTIQSIDSLVEGLNIKLIADSGTLLGICRESGFLKNDYEIDLSICDREGFHKLIRKIGKGKVYKYKGAPYKFEFEIGASSSKVFVDIKLFSLKEDTWTCPAVGRRSIPNKSKESCLKYIFRKLIQILKQKLDFGYFPLSNLVFHDQWHVPSKFFDNLDSLPITKSIYYPSEVSSYLTYRYFNWRSPNPNWISHRDDGGFYRS